VKHKNLTDITEIADYSCCGQDAQKSTPSYKSSGCVACVT